MEGITTYPIQFKEVVYAPDHSECPICGSFSKRYARGSRTLIDLDLDGPVFLHCIVGVYKCLDLNCSTKRRFFRTPVPFAPKGGHYTYRAKDKCTASVREDLMAFNNVPHRMQRDFHIKPAVSTVHRWYHEQAQQLDLFYDYEKWVTDSFSGVLCVDEVYDPDVCLIVATDPLSQKTVAYSVEEQITEVEMKRFFRHLKDELGLTPEVITSDGSCLYPGAIAEVFPESQHQLCLFHIMKNITRDVLKAVLTYRRALPKPQRKRGRPRKDEPSPSNSAKDLFKKRHTFVTRPENLKPEDQSILSHFLQEHEPLRVYRSFMLDVFEMFAQDNTEAAKQKRDEMLAKSFYQDDTCLQRALRRLSGPDFDKMIVFMDYENLNPTNNDAERAARRFRQLQNSHYRLRKKHTIKNMLKHELMRQRNRHPGTAGRLERKDQVEAKPGDT